jgi:hypothetical protein
MRCLQELPYGGSAEHGKAVTAKPPVEAYPPVQQLAVGFFMGGRPNKAVAVSFRDSITRGRE